MRTTLGPFALLSLGSLPAATAQETSGPRYPGFYPGFSYHSSTYEEGVQRGFADIVRSAGAANLMNSEAAKSYEQRCRMSIDNRVYGTEKYFELRQINRRPRRGTRPPAHDGGPDPYAAQRVPDRLSPSGLDPLTGVISWPAILRSPRRTEQTGGDWNYCTPAVRPRAI